MTQTRVTLPSHSPLVGDGVGNAAGGRVSTLSVGSDVGLAVSEVATGDRVSIRPVGEPVGEGVAIPLLEITVVSFAPLALALGSGGITFSFTTLTVHLLFLLLLHHHSSFTSFAAFTDIGTFAGALGTRTFAGALGTRTFAGALGTCTLAGAFARTLAIPFAGAALAAFNAAVVMVEEIEEVHMLASHFDYLLKVRCRSMSDYRAILGEKISSLPYVSSTSTYMSMQAVKDSAF